MKTLRAFLFAALCVASTPQQVLEASTPTSYKVAGATTGVSVIAAAATWFYAEQLKKEHSQLNRELKKLSLVKASAATPEDASAIQASMVELRQKLNSNENAQKWVSRALVGVGVVGALGATSLGAHYAHQGKEVATTVEKINEAFKPLIEKEDTYVTTDSNEVRTITVTSQDKGGIVLNGTVKYNDGKAHTEFSINNLPVSIFQYEDIKEDAVKAFVSDENQAGSVANYLNTIKKDLSLDTIGEQLNNELQGTYEGFVGFLQKMMDTFLGRRVNEANKNNVLEQLGYVASTKEETQVEPSVATTADSNADDENSSSNN